MNRPRQTMLIVVLSFIAFASLPTSLSAADKAVMTNPFFVFDNGVQSIKDPPKILAELGFAGMGASGFRVTRLIERYQAAGLRVFSTYVGCKIGDHPAGDRQWKQVCEELRGTGVVLWLTVSGGKPGQNDDEAAEAVREIADLAGAADVRVALYPHTGLYVATTADAIRVAKKVDRKNLGVSINLCHELMTGQGDRLDETIREAMPRLMMVSINGADPKKPGYGWDHLIQPLGRGSFDVCAFVKKLHAAGYRGPIGLQCFAVKGDQTENLKQSMSTWKEYCARMAAER